MGSHWLRDLPDVIGGAGLDYRLWPGWENRARSSGGYDQVWAVFAHHTASSAEPDDDCSYMWEGSPDQPIGAVLLERSGRVTIGAAGATNTQGKGGPWKLSRGTIPLDKGNAYGIAVEAANNGTGEQWPQAQTDAYTALCKALCDAYGLDPGRDVLAHFEWVEPSCPGRKVDPVGPSPYAHGADSWDMDRFRDDVTACDTPTPPTPSEEDDLTDDQAKQLRELHQYLLSQIGKDGQFVDPGGADLNLPWAAAWNWNYLSGPIDDKLNDIVARLTRLEQKVT